MICSTSWCIRPVKTISRQRCGACNNRVFKGLSLENPPRPMVPFKASDETRLRFVGWLVNENGCWEWAGRLDKKGYGVLATLHKRQAFAHRTAYEVWNGPIEEGLSVCHSCDNPKCINPEHLWLGTQRDNLQDMTRKQRGNTTKLSRDEILEIYSLRRDTDFERGEAAVFFTEMTLKYGVSETSIRNIWSGTTWSVVTGHTNELLSS